MPNKRMKNLLLILCITFGMTAATVAQSSNGASDGSLLAMNYGGEPLSNRAISLFPNPVQNSLSVDLGTSLDHPIEVAVYDFIGQELVKLIVKPNTRSINVDTSELETGVYFIKIQNGSQELVRKFVK